MSLPSPSSNPAVSEEKKQECHEAGKYIRILLERDIKPSDIMTRKAFENALRIIVILGGSTNAVLHFIAIGKSVGIDITQDDFQRMSDIRSEERRVWKESVSTGRWWWSPKHEKKKKDNIHE